MSTNYDFLLSTTYVIFTGQNKKLVKKMMEKYEENKTFDYLHLESDFVKFVYVPITEEIIRRVDHFIVVVHDTEDDFTVFENRISNIVVSAIILCNVRIRNDNVIENCIDLTYVRDNHYVLNNHDTPIYCHLEFVNNNT